MALKPKEIAISKAISVKLDPDTIAIIAHVYHTGNHKVDPNDKSWYKYIGRVVKIADLEAEIAEKNKAENRLNPWKWNCSEWPTDWYFGYDNGNDQAKEVKWLKMKIKKALDWETYLRHAVTGIKKIASTGKEKYYPTAKYEIDDYTDSNGLHFSINNKDELLKRINQTFFKNISLKRDL